MLTQPTSIPVNTSSKAGTPLVFTQADVLNGNSFLNDGRVHICIDNVRGIVPVTVTIFTVYKHDGDLTVQNRIYPVPAGTSIVAGPFDKQLFNNLDDTVQLQSDQPVVILPINPS